MQNWSKGVKKAFISATGLTEKEAAEYLSKTDNNAALSLVMWKLKVDADEAKRILNNAKGNLKLALRREKSSSKNIIPGY